MSTPLHVAIASVDLSAVKRHVLTRECHVPDDRGEYPVHLVAGYSPSSLAEANRMYAIASLVIEATDAAAFAVPDRCGHTPLRIAVGENLAWLSVDTQQRVVDLLARAAPEAASVLCKGETAMHAAAQEGDDDAIRQLVHRAPGAALVPDAYEHRTPLSMAMGHGYAGCTRHLLAEAAALEMTDKRGETPLKTVAMLASSLVGQIVSGDMREDDECPEDAVAWLRDCLDVMHVALSSIDTSLARRHAAEIHDVAGMESLRASQGDDADMSAYVPPMCAAAMVGDSQLIETILNLHPAAVRAACELHGATPLHYACAGGDEDIARLLLVMWPEAVHFQTSTTGEHPVHWAFSARPESAAAIVRALHASCPDVLLQRDEDGWTPLVLAIRAGDADLVRFVVSAAPGCVDLEDALGCHALWYAPHEPNEARTEVIVQTIAAVADPVAVWRPTHGNFTLLHASAKAGNVAHINSLIK